MCRHHCHSCHHLHVCFKPKRFMGDYIAVHGHLPKNELPVRMRHIPYNYIYIRDTLKKNPHRENRTLLHEYREIRLMEHGYKYKNAHKKSGY